MKYLLILLALHLNSSICVINANEEPIDFDKVEMKSFIETLYIQLNNKIIEQSISIEQLKTDLLSAKSDIKSLLNKNEGNTLFNIIKIR